MNPPAFTMDVILKLAEELDAQAIQVLDELFYVPRFQVPDYANRYIKLVRASETLRGHYQPTLDTNVPDEEL